MITFNVPLNSLSLSQSIVPVIKELYKRGQPCLISPIGGQVDLTAYNIDEGFSQYLNKAIGSFESQYDRCFPTLKVWHIRGALEGLSSESNLLTFFEMDSLTDTEINILQNQFQIIVTSKFTCDVIKEFGVREAQYLPLGFDADTFYKKNAPYLDEDICVFSLTGKWELRKQTSRIINLWSKKYGNNRKYRLHLLTNNPFIKPEHENQLFLQATEGKHYYNITRLPRLKTNAEVNDCLNACYSELAGLSSSEAWNWPLFNALCMGKQCPVLNAHVHKDYCSPENSILIEPTHKIKGVDGIHFHDQGEFNRGNWDSCGDEEIVTAMEEVARRFPNENKAGLKLKEEYSVKNATDRLLEILS